MIDFCIYCVIAIQNRYVPTGVIETGNLIEQVDPLNVDKLARGEWSIIERGSGQRLPIIAVCTGPGGIRLCSLHAMTESQDPRNRLPNGFHPYPDRRYTGPGM